MIRATLRTPSRCKPLNGRFREILKRNKMKPTGQSGPRPSRGGPAKTYTSAAAPKPGNALERSRQRYEHYRALAENTRDLDLVTRENYWQHAEHFLRMMAEQRNPGSAPV